MELYATGAFVMRHSKFIIRCVTLSRNEAGGQVSTLDFRLPEAFDYQMEPDPNNLPWIPPKDVTV